MLVTTIGDLRDKEIISLNTGHRLGFVYDAEIALDDGQVLALIVPGAVRFFGLLGREDDIVIPWDNITKIGEDIILVSIEGDFPRRSLRDMRGRKRSFF